MGKELEMKSPKDRSQINTNNLGEFIWWTVHLNIGPEKLLSIIEKVGNSIEEIRKFIDHNKVETRSAPNNK